MHEHQRLFVRSLYRLFVRSLIHRIFVRSPIPNVYRYENNVLKNIHHYLCVSCRTPDPRSSATRLFCNRACLRHDNNEILSTFELLVGYLSLSAKSYSHKNLIETPYFRLTGKPRAGNCLRFKKLVNIDQFTAYVRNVGYQWRFWSLTIFSTCEPKSVMSPTQGEGSKSSIDPTRPKLFHRGIRLCAPGTPLQHANDQNNADFILRQNAIHAQLHSQTP